ncbi:unnamed protein product [Oncorhynchus mykiss]|uniref:Uncharacterized protein n=1 Tax=Oncorhynchus mykiss TaxID=8022 RepID=A0A060X6Y5_ONCMY|nr:unnamed protein product [Oncorhynchus mykiss]
MKLNPIVKIGFVKRNDCLRNVNFLNQSAIIKGNNFLSLTVSPDGEPDEDAEFTLATDFEIGHFFRERIVPRAVLYFTGEALEDDESFEEEELEEGDEEEQDGDDDDEGDFDPKA